MSDEKPTKDVAGSIAPAGSTALLLTQHHIRLGSRHFRDAKRFAPSDLMEKIEKVLATLVKLDETISSRLDTTSGRDVAEDEEATDE